MTGDRYTAVSLVQTCRWFPSQWEVGALPKPLYIRYRNGVLTVHEDWGDEFSGEKFSVLHGDSLDGEMSTETMQQLTAELIDWSRVCETKSGSSRES